MNEKEYYIQKAKEQRGLTDEQIGYFLERDTRYDLLPYYSFCCKRLSCELAYIEVEKSFGRVEAPILLGRPGGGSAGRSFEESVFRLELVPKYVHTLFLKVDEDTGKRYVFYTDDYGRSDSRKPDMTKEN